MNATIKSLAIAAGGLALVFMLTSKKRAVAAANTQQQTLMDRMKAYAQLNNPTKPATQIENLALPGSDAWGWQYFTDGVAISPSGDYYLNGNKVWSPSK